MSETPEDFQKTAAFPVTVCPLRLSGSYRDTLDIIEGHAPSMLSEGPNGFPAQSLKARKVIFQACMSNRVDSVGFSDSSGNFYNLVLQLLIF